MSEDDASTEMDHGKREADEELGDLDSTGDDLEQRLEENEAMTDEIEVPEPDRGDSLSISEPPDDDSDEGAAEEAGVDADAVPEGEGEAAEEAGQ
ncbi:MAG: hypothetical protein M3Y34_03020 [Actinomycetota bacterium]|nr:hypothetical protein [Actinomycetota bacterium]